MEYAEINNFQALFDVRDFTLNFNMEYDNEVKYFGMKFELVGPESIGSSRAAAQVRNNYKILFLRDVHIDEEEFKNMGLHFLDQISNYI